MTGQEWIAAFAVELGVAAPSAETFEELLALAGTAAHSSERIAAPIACYLVGLAGVLIGLIPAYRCYRYSLADGMTIRI